MPGAARSRTARRRPRRSCTMKPVAPALTLPFSSTSMCHTDRGSFMEMLSALGPRVAEGRMMQRPTGTSSGVSSAAASDSVTFLNSGCWMGRWMICKRGAGG